MTTPRLMLSTAPSLAVVRSQVRADPGALALQDGEVPKETALCAFRRYLMLEPDHVEVYIAYLRTIGKHDEAASKLSNVVDDEDFCSMEGKTRRSSGAS